MCSQGLEVIESTNLKYFTKEMTAEFYALKGMFLAQINKYAASSYFLFPQFDAPQLTC